MAEVMNWRNPWASVALSSCIACGALNGAGRFEADAFHHGHQPVVIAYSQPATRSLLGSDWVVDNFRYSHGAPSNHKGGPEYTRTYQVDYNNDGQYVERGPVPRVDLLLEHRKHGGIIWMETVPLRAHRADKELRSFMHDLLSSYTTPTVTIDMRGQSVALREHRYAHRLLELRPCRLAGREALTATFDVANVEQLRMPPEVIDARVRLVLVRTNYAYAALSLGKTAFPSVLLLGYANQPASFERGVGDFERFLAAIALGEGQASEPENLKRGFACSAPVFAAPPQPPASAPNEPRPSQPTPAPPPEAPPAPDPVPEGTGDN